MHVLIKPPPDRLSVPPSSLKPRLRRMQLEDIDAVMAIEKKVYPHPWSKTILRDCLQVGYDCWVIELGSEIAGYAVLSQAVGEAHLLNLALASPWQGRGLGRWFLHRLTQFMHVSGSTEIFLEVRPSNLPALRLYQAAGFREIGRRNGYYPAHNGREDALILSLVPGQSMQSRDHLASHVADAQSLRAENV